MELFKVYDRSCDICALLSGIDEEIAQSEGFFFRQQTLTQLAATPGYLRDYVKGVHVNEMGEIDIPIYMLITPQGHIQAEGIVRSVEELQNLINAWKTWASSRK